MKKYLIVLLVLVSLSCQLQQPTDEYLHAHYGNSIINQPLHYGDFSEIEKITDITPWIMKRVAYQTDQYDNTTTPQQTLFNGYGDCEDISILYLNILYVRFNVKGNLVMFDSSDIRTIELGGEANHVAVEIKSSCYLEPQTGDIINAPVRYIYEFDIVFID